MTKRDLINHIKDDHKSHGGAWVRKSLPDMIIKHEQMHRVGYFWSDRDHEVTDLHPVREAVA